MEIKTALDFLLTPEKKGFGPDGYSCEDCPFSTLLDNYEDVSNDLSEAYYHCDLFNEKVWGEYPTCTLEMWIKQANKEMDDIYVGKHRKG